MRGMSLAILMLLVGAAAGAGVVWFGFVHPVGTDEARSSADSSQPDEAASDATSALSVNAAGEAVVRLDAYVQQRVGLTTEALQAATRRPVVAAYGLLQEDPSLTFTLRAPASGTLRAGDGNEWPGLYAAVGADDLVGVVAPRLTPMEQIDLSARLTQARADAAEAEASLASARSSYEHKRALNAENKAVSDRALEEARAAVQTQEARLQAAQRIVELVEAGHNGSAATDAMFDLRVPLTGEVVDVLARPGEAVEPGQSLLQVASFDSLMARVELPVGVTFDLDARTADIELVGTGSRGLQGERIGLGATAATAAHGTVLLYRVSNSDRSLRPGAPIVAQVPAPGGERAGVLIPSAAVIRLFGRLWVYVAGAEGTFIRRRLVEGDWVDESWFTVAGFAPGDRVVTAGAQVLLSEELKAQIEREEAASE